VTQTLQRLMFNMNGTHKSDSEIAETVPRAIQQMIHDGVMKPENAPQSPIKGFEDANQFLIHYPSDATQPSASAGGSGPAAAAPDCPKDQPWLCPVAGAAPQAARAAANTPPGSAQSAPSNTDAAAADAAPKTASEDSTGKKPGQDDKTPFYVYGPNDVVGVTVAGESTVSGTFPIMPDGRISMALIGTFKAAGLTTPQLTDVITQRLREDGGILEPIVNVQLLRSNSKFYKVFGAVLRPGLIPLIQETTILDALAISGFQEFANTKKITVRRGNKTFKFNYKDAIQGKGLDHNITLEDGDIVNVPE
jgi:polysaccharide export outer membrane protein